MIEAYYTPTREIQLVVPAPTAAAATDRTIVLVDEPGNKTIPFQHQGDLYICPNQRYTPFIYIRVNNEFMKVQMSRKVSSTTII
jgi:hypothetical protein